ncbi:uncharacterized protein LOC119567444 isoform X6 [Chelonia mydas]|uniref:uncharacterized protein LOC119567444 isoform X6 n=1 Tax=Chelonia mydas TaxID=8469 RepID=UPI001CA7DF59|nr:uncharacterized protein LOC119567444 isoform X6 [Chelonia mydas]
MAFYKMPKDAKKLELPLGAPACVQKRQPAYPYFPEEASLILNPTFYPEIELKNQGDSMGPSPVVNEAKDVKVLQDRMQRHLLLAMMQAELRSKEGEEEEPVYMDLAAMVSLDDSEAESQAVTDDCWLNGNIIMITKPESYRITSRVRSELPSEAEQSEPELQDEISSAD